MRDLGPDLQLDAHVACGGAGGEPGGVVEQDLVRADLDERGRQAGQVVEERARVSAADRR